MYVLSYVYKNFLSYVCIINIDKKPVHSIYRILQFFTLITIRFQSVYTINVYYNFTCTTQIPGNWRCNDNHCIQL